MVIAERRGLRRAVDAYVLVIGAIGVALGTQTARIGRNWTLADWLINYQGGFVRRGLPGEVIFLLHRWLHVPLADLAVAIWLSLTIILLIVWRRLILNAANRVWVFALLCSPATLAFGVLAPAAGFRKELILLAGFSAFLVLLCSKKLSDFASGPVIGVVLLVSVLSHESSIFFAPYFFAALVVRGHSLKRAAQICFVPFLIAFLAAGVSAKFRGDVGVAARICTSLGYTLSPQNNGEVCHSGAIAFLQYSTPHALHATMQMARQCHYLTGYSILALLSVAPILLGSWELRRTGVRARLQVCWAMAALSFLFSILLFVMAEDWGRWIHMHIMCLGALVLVLSGATEAQEDRAEMWARSRIRSFAIGVALVAYAVGWTLPPASGWSWRSGYVAAAHDIGDMFTRRVPGLRAAGLPVGSQLRAAPSGQI